MLEDLVEIFLSNIQSHTLESTGSVVGVLEVGSDIVTLRLNGYVSLYLPLSGLAGSLANFLGIPLY